jgi:AcrR family transcriptional regulator
LATADPRIGIKTGYHHGDLRAQLLEAVRHLIEIKGNSDFSISEASRLAGVSSGAPYKHFKDKPAIMKAVCFEAMNRKSSRMQSAIKDIPRGSIARIEALGRAYIDFAREEPGVFRLVYGMTEDHKDDEELMKAGRDTLAIVVNAVADYLGITPNHPEAARRAYLLWCFVHGHSFLIIDDKASVHQIPVDENQMLAAVARGVLDQPVE